MARGRRGGMFSPSYLVRSNAISRGVFGGNRTWRIVAAIIFGRRFLKKLMGNEPEVVATEVLAPGQFLSIRAIDPRTERRSSRR